MITSDDCKNSAGIVLVKKWQDRLMIPFYYPTAPNITAVTRLKPFYRDYICKSLKLSLFLYHP
jgi:hypothetical protein